MKVSIIIPTFNRGGRLTATVDSALAQTYPDSEILIVDDCSTDETREVCEGIGDRRVRAIHHAQNLGVSAARNSGIRAARGELIAFLDDDDSWLPEKLERQIPLFQDPEVGFVYCGAFFVDAEGAVKFRAVPRRRGWIYRDLLFKNCTAATSVVVARRECFERAGFFDERLTAFEDHDMWIRIARHYRFDFVPDALINYAVGAHERLNRPSRLVSMYDRFIDKFDTYEYESSLLKRRAIAYRHYVLGTMFDVGGQTRPARSAYVRSLTLWPLNLKAWIGLAVSLAGGRASRGLALIKARALAFANRMRAR